MLQLREVFVAVDQRLQLRATGARGRGVAEAAC